MLTVDLENKDGFQIVKPIGSISYDTANDFAISMREALKSRRIIINMEGLDYISSSGLREIVSAFKESKTTGSAVVICSMSMDILKIFNISGLSRILSIAKDEDSAMAMIKNA